MMMNNENYLTKLCVDLGIARPCGVQFDALFGSLDREWESHFGTVDYPRGKDGVFTLSSDYVGKRSLKNDCFNRNGKGVKYDLFFSLEESGLFVDVKDKNPHCPKVWEKKKLKSGKEVSNGLEVTLLGSPSATKSEDVYNTILEKDYALLFVWKDEEGTVCLQSMNALDYCDVSSRGLKSIVKKGRGGLEIKIREKKAYVSASSPIVKLTGVEFIDRSQILGLIGHLTPAK